MRGLAVWWLFELPSWSTTPRVLSHESSLWFWTIPTLNMYLSGGSHSLTQTIVYIRDRVTTGKCILDTLFWHINKSLHHPKLLQSGLWYNPELLSLCHFKASKRKTNKNPYKTWLWLLSTFHLLLVILLFFSPAPPIFTFVFSLISLSYTIPYSLSNLLVAPRGIS